MASVTQLCAECRQERQRFAAHGERHSPGCSGLWRRACAKDEEAWRCFQSIFEPWLARLCNAAVSRAPRISGLSQQDAPDIVQDVWHNLWRYTVRNPAEALDLVGGDDLSRLVEVIKTAAKRRVLELCRKERAYEAPLPADDGPEGDDGETGRSPLPAVVPPAVEGVLDLLAFLEKHMKSVQERVVAEIIFLQGMKPQDVIDLHPGEFANVRAVNQVQQNLIRRLRSDPARQNFVGSASLEFRLDHNEVRMDPFEPCPYDEGILLDYINGHVDATMRAAIERSPVCVEAIARLKADIEEWRPALRQMFCPQSERLLAYQERRLIGTDYLVVHHHVQQCLYCRAEVEMLGAADAAAITPAPSLVRRLYELIFRPATLSPVPVLGEGSYRTVERTPQIELLVRTTRTTGKQRNWMLSGRLRYDDDQPVTQVDAITMQDTADEDAPVLSTTVDEMGLFTIKGLDAGVYRLRILRAQEEIILHEFNVGDDL
ncbi:MAG: carboxypeptidase-like regulatory domain-containing protein [Caldilineaceae bacterium]